MNNKKIFFTIAVLAIILLGALFFIDNTKKPSSQLTTRITPTSALPKETIVTLTDSGFTPKEIRIKKGEAIQFKNATEKDATINSDNHPTHQLYPELNLGQLEKNKILIHIFMKPGKLTYHNHFNPTIKGTIIVE